MERTRNIRTPDAILTGDWHLREDTPTCFKGDFETEQWNSVVFVADLQKKYNCPVLHAGDLFHHWKPSPWLLSRCIELFPKEFYTIYGQHDLPQHNLQLEHKSGINTLRQARIVKVLKGCHFGQEPNYKDNIEGVPSYIFNKGLPNYKRVLVWHHLTYLQKPFPGATGGMAEGILRKYPQFDLIVTGDNHTSFTIEYQGRRLVNTGNLTRQSVAQIDFKPCIWFWYASDNSVEQVFLPIQEGVISREHIDIKEQRNERIDAFVEELQSDWESNMSFEDNLKKCFIKNDISKEVQSLIYQAIEK